MKYLFTIIVLSLVVCLCGADEASYNFHGDYAEFDGKTLSPAKQETDATVPGNKVTGTKCSTCPTNYTNVGILEKTNPNLVDDHGRDDSTKNTH
jgi:hypothetical protein